MSVRRVPLLLLVSACLLSWFYLDAAAQQTAPQRDSNATAAPGGGSEDAGPTADKQDAERALEPFMRQKLSASRRILKGLMTDDLKLVADNADKLLDMSHEERWRASNDMLYLQHSLRFRQAVQNLYSDATRNSMDGASLAWVKVTLSCIKCHDWVRDTMLADLTQPAQ